MPRATVGEAAAPGLVENRRGSRRHPATPTIAVPLLLASFFFRLWWSDTSAENLWGDVPRPRLPVHDDMPDTCNCIVLGTRQPYRQRKLNACHGSRSPVAKCQPRWSTRRHSPRKPQALGSIRSLLALWCQTPLSRTRDTNRALRIVGRMLFEAPSLERKSHLTGDDNSHHCVR